MRDYIDTVSAEPGTDWTITTLNTTEAVIWSPKQLTPIKGGSPRLGKVWRVSAGGSIGAAGDITLNVYYGVSPTDPNGGLIGTLVIPHADVGPFYIDLKALVRLVAVFVGPGLFVDAFGMLATGTGKGIALGVAKCTLGDTSLDAAITVTMTSSSNAAGQSVMLTGPVMEEMD